MKYNNTLVSVIMPCHNGGAYIADAIDSVRAQTYTDWELLVIDDCSTDDTVAIAEAYCARDNRIRLLHTDKSYGKPFYPRNIGIENACGRYIAFLDCDDVWLPTKLERQVPFFTNDSAAVVFSDYYKFSTNSKEDKSRVVKAPARVSFKSALYGNPIGNCTAVYDIQKTGKVFFTDAGHEDYILWLTILRMGFCAVNTKTVEAGYQVSSKSVSANKRKAACWTWNIYRHVLHMDRIRAAFCYLIYILKGCLKYIK